MSRFEFRALDPTGKTATGVVEAGSRQEAIGDLRSRGYRPIRVSRTAGSTPVSVQNAANGESIKPVPKAAAENFMRQLASLLSAGVPLATALTRLADEASNSAAAATWSRLRALVADGTALADAMGQFPRTFPKVTTAMVRAGETGGFLELVLEQIADFQSRDRELRGRLLAAAVYPCVLTVLATVVVVFLLIFFIPRFQEMFDDFDARLPFLTELVINTSHVVRRWWLLWSAAVFIAVLGFRSWLRSDRGRRKWEKWVLRMPIAGPLVSRYAMTRFCSMLGTLTNAGVTLVTALRVARESLGNQILVDAVSTAIQRIQQGGALAECLRECKQLFPGSAVEIISVAEHAGRLGPELVRLADTTERDLNRRLQISVSLAEPAMLCVMALVIGVIIVSMILPIFTIQDYIH